MIDQETISALFVTWQDAQTRRYFPVARLVCAPYEGALLYEFAYIRGAAQAKSVGFQPFLAFPELDQVYRSCELFPFFANRVMSRKRPDFREYMSRLNLPPDATPMQMLSRSAGTRATDSIELFGFPARNPEQDGFVTHFWLHGFRHLDEVGQKRVLALEPGEALNHVPEPDNTYDANAVRLESREGIKLGYIPRYLASDAVKLINDCSSFEVFVEQVNPDPAPLQHRLLCRLVSCWPSSFEPCSQETYQPLVPERITLDPCQSKADD